MHVLEALARLVPMATMAPETLVDLEGHELVVRHDGRDGDRRCHARTGAPVAATEARRSPSRPCCSSRQPSSRSHRSTACPPTRSASRTRRDEPPVADARPGGDGPVLGLPVGGRARDVDQPGAADPAAVAAERVRSGAARGAEHAGDWVAAQSRNRAGAPAWSAWASWRCCSPCASTSIPTQLGSSGWGGSCVRWRCCSARPAAPALAFGLGLFLWWRGVRLGSQTATLHRTSKAHFAGASGCWSLSRC